MCGLLPLSAAAVVVLGPIILSVLEVVSCYVDRDHATNLCWETELERETTNVWIFQPFVSCGVCPYARSK